MKQTIIMVMTVMITLFSTTTFAKETITKASFKVSGNCDICKSRIEKAAKTDGVKSAVWDVNSHIITVKFLPTKISVNQIQQNIANAGYNTEKFAASDSAYKRLPQCCQYEK